MSSPAAVTGTFEPTGRNEGGHLRACDVHYRIRGEDVIVPTGLVRELNLRGGETIAGTVKSKRGKSRSNAGRNAAGRNGAGKNNGKGNAARSNLYLAEVDTINGLAVDDFAALARFEEQTAIDPERPIQFETKDGPLSMRIVDLMTPIGFGSRGLIAAPPRTGKTILLQQMAHGIATNHPDVYMMVLLIDERPEEVTDMRRNVHGEVIASSNDENIASHVRIGRLMIEKAKRHVECGEDVVILLDSLTRLGRAFNAACRQNGRIMSGGLSVGALNEPKSIFGAARNLEGGGSLTIIASALIETGSRMDDVIFNEFKGTGNMEIMLSRDMSNRRVWPAIDLSQSGTRKEERLLTPAALEVSHHIRRNTVPLGDVRAMEMLLESLGKFPDNEAYIKNQERQTFKPRRFSSR